MKTMNIDTEQLDKDIQELRMKIYNEIHAVQRLYRNKIKIEISHEFDLITLNVHYNQYEEV